MGLWWLLSAKPGQGLIWQMYLKHKKYGHNKNLFKEYYEFMDFKLAEHQELQG